MAVEDKLSILGGLARYDASAGVCSEQRPMQGRGTDAAPGVVAQVGDVASEEDNAAMVETALRLFLLAQREEVDVKPLPTFKSGGHVVDVADREALYRAMEED